MSLKRLESGLSSLVEEVSSIKEVIAIILFGSFAGGIMMSILIMICW